MKTTSADDAAAAAKLREAGVTDEPVEGVGGGREPVRDPHPEVENTAAHKIKGFIEKAARAGVNRVFLGLENINPESLKEAHKGQNRITEYRASSGDQSGSFAGGSIATMPSRDGNQRPTSSGRASACARARTARPIATAGSHS